MTFDSDESVSQYIKDFQQLVKQYQTKISLNSLLEITVSHLSYGCFCAAPTDKEVQDVIVRAVSDAREEAVHAKERMKQKENDE